MEFEHCFTQSNWREGNSRRAMSSDAELTGPSGKTPYSHMLCRDYVQKGAGAPPKHTKNASGHPKDRSDGNR